MRKFYFSATKGEQMWFLLSDYYFKTFAQLLIPAMGMVFSVFAPYRESTRG
ncbi:hypothetical protein [Syntrophorhabdus aromaticivorans]|uniref:hypothetical protein n=1 Tax=Syntrophorhabdus aromaticivorans TaxID=328301 RepID=UPI000423B5D4|nr:hypothetical protein [Syntrophorhabdus aromaticivorans]